MSFNVHVRLHKPYSNMDVSMDLDGLPSLDSVADYDFSAFLNDMEPGLFPAGDNSSNNNVSSGDDSSSAMVSPTQSLVPIAPRPVISSVSPSSASASGRPKTVRSKAKLERRGHTKSRNGCYNCKRRRIKVSQLGVSIQAPWD